MIISIYLFAYDEDDYLFENVEILSNSKPTYSSAVRTVVAELFDNNHNYDGVQEDDDDDGSDGDDDDDDDGEVEVLPCIGQRGVGQSGQARGPNTSGDHQIRMRILVMVMP